MFQLIRQLFCKHMHDFTRRAKDRDRQVKYQVDIYTCRKCGHTQVKHVPGSSTRL